MDRVKTTCSAILLHVFVVQERYRAVGWLLKGNTHTGTQIDRKVLGRRRRDRIRCLDIRAEFLKDWFRPAKIDGDRVHRHGRAGDCLSDA
jgi:hypothetical protein